jgi:hypothetical protein
MTNGDARKLLEHVKAFRAELLSISLSEEKETGHTTVVGSLNETISWLGTLKEELNNHYSV